MKPTGARERAHLATELPVKKANQAEGDERPVRFERGALGAARIARCALLTTERVVAD